MCTRISAPFFWNKVHNCKKAIFSSLSSCPKVIDTVTVYNYDCTTYTLRTSKQCISIVFKIMYTHLFYRITYTHNLLLNLYSMHTKLPWQLFWFCFINAPCFPVRVSEYRRRAGVHLRFHSIIADGPTSFLPRIKSISCSIYNLKINSV